jgi:ABC-type lipoprotein export system ATPase subunit
MIKIEKLSKKFQSTEGQDIEIFRELNLDIKAGEFIAIMGPS